MKRPFGVTLVGVLLLVQGLFLMILAGAAFFLNATQGSAVPAPLLALDYTTLTITGVLSAMIVGALGIFIVLSGIGVLRLLSWAWLAAMALQGWTLALFLWSHFTRAQSDYSGYPGVFLSVVIVFYLHSRAVRSTFDLVRRRESARAVPQPIAHAALSGDSEVTGHSKGTP